MPHGYCFMWRPSVLWLHVCSDAAIAFAYYCLPFVIFYFIRKRNDLPFQAVFILFAAFILLCGTTHLLSIWVLWHPDYYIEGAVKAMTAVVSLVTLVTTLVYVPRALGVPGPFQLAEANLQLKALYERSEERGRVMLSAVVDHLGDGVITIDEAGAIESFNTACAGLFGYGPSEVIGKNFALLLPALHLSEHQDYIDIDPETGNARVLVPAVCEARALRKDGSMFPMHFSLNEFMLDGERHFCGVIRDITKQKQAEDTREQMLAKLTRSNAELERFAYVASHDMQEPLRMVIAFSEIVIKDYAGMLDEDGNECLKIIGASALRMRGMVQDLLDYARLGGQGVNFLETDLAEEFRHVTENLRTLIAESGAAITYDELPRLRCNPVQVMRLLQNLITNAIKFQRPGQIPLIHFGVLREEPGNLFFVRDNGIGIETEFLSQIFEPFRRLHRWEAIKGSGLGLAVCRKIIENHDGEIWAESNPGVGTTIFFSLAPRVAGRSWASAAIQNSEAGEGPAG
jgi:PAS domain S-box-containing protein